MTRLQYLAIIKVENAATHPDAPATYISGLTYRYVEQHIGFLATDRYDRAEIYNLQMARILVLDLKHSFPMFEFEVIKLG